MASDVVIKLSLDTTEFDAVLSALDDVAKLGRQVPGGFFDPVDKLFTLDTDAASANADEVIVRLKPTDRLLGLLAAIRAGDFDSSVVV